MKNRDRVFLKGGSGIRHAREDNSQNNETEYRAIQILKVSHCCFDYVTGPGFVRSGGIDSSPEDKGPILPGVDTRIEVDVEIT